MSGIFGVVSKENCAETLFYGTDYHSHLGTEYGGIAVLDKNFTRQIHNINQSQFKSKFYDDYKHIKGNKGNLIRLKGRGFFEVRWRFPGGCR